jgi:hypothetical protein
MSSEEEAIANEVTQIEEAADRRFLWEGSAPALERQLHATETILRAVLEVLTPEQRAAIFERVKL